MISNVSRVLNDRTVENVAVHFMWSGAPHAVDAAGGAIGVYIRVGSKRWVSMTEGVDCPIYQKGHGD